MSSGYPNKRARTRRALITAAMRVLARRGPDGAKIADIAAEAGVATGTVYNHFASLADLIDAVAGELRTGVEIGDTTLAAIENDPAARVAIGTRQLVGLVDSDPDAAAAFVTLLATVADFRADVRSLVSGAIAAGAAQGRFRVANVEVATDACLGAVTQWIRSRLAGEAGATDRDRLETMLRIVGLDDAVIDDVVTRALTTVSS